MSCGPSKAMLEIADQVDALNAKIDGAIMSAPGMSELAGLKDKVNDIGNGIMDKVKAAVPSIDFPIKSFDQLPLQDQMKEIAGLIALGVVALPEYKAKLELMKNKYDGIDGINIDNLADMLRSGAMDLDSICKMVPNVDTQGVNVAIKGIPTSFADVDPVAILRGAELPKIQIDDVYVETTKVLRQDVKNEKMDFLNIELPTFD